MSYQVLARRWRPRDFTTLIGQEHVVRALTHALEQQRLHHAYLFTGTRGVGKTTLSRILAKALNCVGAEGQGGITAQPCGVCRACTEIDAGRFVDYIEMDAASNRGVDDMAQLLDRAVYAPTAGRFKVYMIDEVHMLTHHAFNAMLKTLEEPPGHVKFILATTDPQKIPVTVLSRCLQFNLKQMPPGHIVSRLDRILEEEGIPREPNALRRLAFAAQGSMRDALSLADQAIAYGAGEVTEATVSGMLGAIDQGCLVRLLDALADARGAALIGIADEMAERSLSFSAALQDLAALLQKIALAQIVPEAVQEDWPEAGEVRRLAGRFDAQSVQLFYQFANLGRSELALAPDEYAGFTMTLLRMLAFQPGQSDESATPPSGGAQQAASLPIAAPARQSPAAQALAAARLAADRGDSASLRPDTPAPPPWDAPPGHPANAQDPIGAPSMAPRAPPASSRNPPRPASAALNPARAAAPEREPAAVAPPDLSASRLAAFDGDWPMLAARLPLRGLAQQLARQSELAAIDGATLRLRVPVPTLKEASAVERLEAALSEHFDTPVRVMCEVGAACATAAAVDAGQRVRRQRGAEDAIAADPFVQALVRDFSAQVIPESIQPRAN